MGNIAKRNYIYVMAWQIIIFKNKASINAEKKYYSYTRQHNRNCQFIEPMIFVYDSCEKGIFR